MTLDFGRLLDAMAENNPDLAAGATELDGVTIHYSGTMTMHMTSWVASEEQQLLRSDSDGTFDFTMSFSGMSGLSPGTDGDLQAAFKGDFTQKLSTCRARRSG